MASNLKLFNVGNFEFRLQHLLIIGILAVSFSTSALARSQAADYGGLVLNEFDPFFNFRATQFVTDNGLGDYFSWHDDMSWHPYGRDVSSTSQVMLHLTAAALYKVFGFGMSLYDFTVIFPVVFGSFTAIVIFALVRVIAGTTAGLFAALFYSVSAPIMIRGMIGWFKSEPLGLFYALLGIYLFLSAIKHDKGKVSFIKLVFGGIFLGFALSAWGGTEFFAIPLGIFFLTLPFVKKSSKFLIWAIPVFIISLMLTAISFEKVGTSFVLGYGGFLLIGPTAFLVISMLIQKISKEQNKIRNNLIFLGGTVATGIATLLVGSIGLPTFRYLNAINPFLTTKDALTDSVAEHSTTSTELSFYYFSILMIFAAIGVWFIFRNKGLRKDFTLKNEMTTFALIIGFLGVYTSSAFVRLEVFAAISVIILSSVGLSILTSEIFKNKKLNEVNISKTKNATKIVFFVLVIALLVIPTSIPVNANWITGIKAPPTLLNGGSSFNIATNDWPAAMEWLKNNTPKDAVVASWWDYGYWITTLGERKSSADNATLIDWQIKLIAKMFLSSPTEAWKILTCDKPLECLDADYVLVYVTAQRGNDQEPGIYILHGGGDESKKIWFMRIAGEPESKHLFSDGNSGTKEFWENTMLGQMFPFSIITYGDLQRNLQSDTYKPGYVEIHQKNIKFPNDGNGPLRLVYASPSFDRNDPGPMSIVLIYEVNKDYKPNEVSITDSKPPESESVESLNVEENTEFATIKTAFGDITILLNRDVAPKTVENFKNLANSGFYDGTIFHRIITGFVIQGGDPNTISGSRDTWGRGGPNYTILPEFSDLSHTKYVVSMARGSDINSAGSQFFIVLDDAPSLDGQYTIFGEVVSGKEVVDKIASLETNSDDQPIHPLDARIETITITKP